MLTGNTQFEIDLKKVILEEIERLSGILNDGRAVKDYAEYRHMVGEIAALRRVTDSYCGEVQTKLSKR